MVGILLVSCDDLKNSLNAAVLCGKDGRRSHLGEQVHQAPNRSRIKLLHGLDQLASEILIHERFAQPMELLHGPLPRHGVGQAPFVTQLLFHQHPLVSGVDRDSGIEFSGIASGELLIGTDLHT